METPFRKKSYHTEIDQLICKPINLLVSIWYELLLKGISKQAMVQVFFKDMFIFKKQSNTDSLEISYVWYYLLGQIVPSEKPTIKLNVLLRCYVYFNRLLLLKSFL